MKLNRKFLHALAVRRDCGRGRCALRRTIQQGPRTIVQFNSHERSEFTSIFYSHFYSKTKKINYVKN